VNTPVYRWESTALVYLQMWNEFSGFDKPGQLAFDESGDVRVLYPTDRDQFFAGPGAAVPTSLESRLSFSAKPLARSHRSGGDAKVPRRVPHDASRLRTVRTLASRVQRSPSRYAHQSGILRSSCDHSRARLRPGDSGIHPSLGASPDTPRHRSARV
jgi:hypothetical protein